MTHEEFKKELLKDKKFWREYYIWTWFRLDAWKDRIRFTWYRLMK